MATDMLSAHTAVSARAGSAASHGMLCHAMRAKHAVVRTCDRHVVLDAHPDARQLPKGWVVGDVEPRLDCENHPCRAE